MNLLFSVSRMHLALKAYQELLLTVNEMDRSKDENIQHGSNVIKSKFFFFCCFFPLQVFCPNNVFSFIFLFLICHLFASGWCRQYLLSDGVQGDFSDSLT